VKNCKAILASFEVGFSFHTKEVMSSANETTLFHGLEMKAKRAGAPT
jgi:hypothetical protein